MIPPVKKKSPAVAGFRLKKAWPSLSVVIPVYNEEKTIQEIIRRVRAVSIPKEIIVVDDASTDQTIHAIQKVSGPDLKLIRLAQNSGKGSALREGFKQASNEVVLVQDADLEYDPADYEDLLLPFVRGHADVVYGSRFLTTKTRRVLFFWHWVINSGLTLLCNMFTNLNLSDMETCYKVFRREVIQSVDLKEKRFGFEPEVTIKLSRRPVRFFEVGISYYGRSYAEGKKIRPRDAVRALYCILKYGLFG